MSKWVSALLLRGIPSPFAPDTQGLVLYADGQLPTTGRPAELSSATVISGGRLVGLPGLQWSGTPRDPVKSQESATITLQDDPSGTLATLLMRDPDSQSWALTVNRLDDATTAISVTGSPIPTASTICYLNNEAVYVSAVGASTGSATPTTALTITRAQSGSYARVHLLRPSQSESGTTGGPSNFDRIKLTRKPNFEAGFYATFYAFQIDAANTITGQLVRHAIVDGEPLFRLGDGADQARVDLKLKWLEDVVNDHKIGSCQEVELGYPILVKSELGTGTPVVRATEITIVLSRDRADRFFDQPTGLLTSGNVNATTVADLSTRLLADKPNTAYEVLVKQGGDAWLYKINGIVGATIAGASSAALAVQLSCSLIPLPQDKSVRGERPQGGAAIYLRPWWSNPQKPSTNQAQDGSPPTISLRLVTNKSLPLAFANLCISDDGGTGSAYDKYLGGAGIGFPAAYLNLGTAVANTAAALAALPGNTKELLKLNQLNGKAVPYQFDLTKPTSMGDWLANECRANFLVLGTKSAGELMLASWVHEVAATATLAAHGTERPRIAESLVPIKRIRLTAKTDQITLEPTASHELRYLTARTATEAETEEIRLWDQTIDLTAGEFAPGGDLFHFQTVFARMLGGRQVVYEVPCSLARHLALGIEKGDAVNWSDTKVPSPSGRGVSGQFFIIGIDPDPKDGLIWYRLAENRLFSATDSPRTPGRITPTLTAVSSTAIDATHRAVVVKLSDSLLFNPAVDYSGFFDAVKVAGSRLKLHNFKHAPIGTQERGGSVEAHVLIDSYVVDGGGVCTLTLSIDAADLRGNYSTIDLLFIDGDTKIVVPDRETAENTRIGVLVEADPDAVTRVFASLEPQDTLTGKKFTFSP